ncbi:amidohydrolase family protein [Paraburkholderia sp. Ac-20340]|uniref:metal-dependent hydrolase family protein n=1 Tax=Paraburkholderia sp. Ac-20340 TaxID=2703888 RepID=UPI00197F58ED|nr:amidohydrolase family protein [Paraburkholderia sp. Ac-20340]MBN3853964.1 amidohydrolase family protein [Paraburkholderia sp. Ac-20340]
MSEILIRNARLLDTLEGKLTSGMDIRIDGELIVEVGSGLNASAGTTVYDANGRVVMPGLIDAHVHSMAAVNDHMLLACLSPYLVAAHAKENLASMLRRGFTSVRDAGGAEGGLAEASRLRLFESPRLFVAGLALAVTAGQGDFRRRPEHTMGCPMCRSTRTISRTVDGVDEIRKAVREEIMSGASQIKVMASGGNSGNFHIETPHFTEEELRTMVTEARSFGKYVMAHAYGVTAIRRAVDAGVRTIEHGNLIDEETAKYIADKAYVVPTLTTYEAGIKHAPDFKTKPHIVEQIKDVLERGTAALRMMRNVGVKLGFGTDLEGICNPYQLREFALRTRGGETTSEILHSATIVNAEILQMEGKLGVLKPGALADLLIVDGNPLEDLGLFQEDGSNIKLTMVNGHVYKDSLPTN